MAKTEPTKTQIAAELEALKKLPSKIPEYSLFGDKNWENAQVCIRVIEEHMDQDDIDAIWSEDGCADNDEEFSQSMYDAANDTLAWLEGDDPESWSKGWD